MNLKRYLSCAFWLALSISLSGCSAIFNGGDNFTEVKTKIGGCAPSPCAKVEIAALPSLPESINRDARGAIESEIKKVLYAPLDVDTTEPTRDGVLAELKERVKEYDSVSDAPIDWSLVRTAKIIYNDPRVISLELTNTGYLGGAHGFNERSLMTFDCQTGKRLSVTDLIEDRSRQTLNKVLEAEFRRARSIQTSQTLQDAGFFILPGQELPLGENFALSDKGLEIQYNPYEIAPYALGETRVRLPSEAIAPLVRSDLSLVFADNASNGI
jgi:hypothetical protein